MSDLPPWVDGWCRTILGAEPVEALFRVSQLSEVVGVRLTDGREVVVKRRVDESGRAGRLLADLVRRLAALDLDPPLPNPEWVRWDAMPERETAKAVSAWIEDTTPTRAGKAGRMRSAARTRPRRLGSAEHALAAR